MTKLQNTTTNNIAMIGGGAAVGAAVGAIIGGIISSKSKNLEEKSDKIIFTVLLAIIGAGLLGGVGSVLFIEQPKK
jgi:high-affinity Fe2+/Pb2+ permease